MPLGNASPVRSNIPKKEVAGVWTGGGAAANCTKTSTDWSKGIQSVNYNAATGKYRITLTDFGQQLLPGSHIEIHRAAAGAPRVANIVRGSLTISVSSGVPIATVDFEVWDLATPSLVDLTATDLAAINLVFADQAYG